MQIEEVSLVDHAANKRRFLIVKRENALEESNEVAPTQSEEAVETPVSPETELPAESPEQSADQLAAAVDKLHTLLDALQARVQTPIDTPNAEKASSPVLVQQLDAVQEAVKSIGTSMQALTQRTARLEKCFGLPNSVSEPQTTAAPRDTASWPLDLNEPYERDSIDERLSFYTP